MNNAPSVTDLKLAEGATKAENHEPWMDFMEEAKAKVNECFRNKVTYKSGYCRVLEKLAAQPVDLWGWATLNNGVIEIKVQYGMAAYPPQKTYHLSIGNWDIMWMSPEYYLEMVCHFMEQEKKAEKRAQEKKASDEMLAREKKIQDELEAKRVKLLEKISKDREDELNDIKAHPWRYAFRQFKERHIVKDMTAEEDLNTIAEGKDVQ